MDNFLAALFLVLFWTGCYFFEKKTGISGSDMFEIVFVVLIAAVIGIVTIGFMFFFTRDVFSQFLL